MTMRYVLKLYPNSDQEADLACQVLAQLKTVVDGRAGYLSVASAIDGPEEIIAVGGEKYIQRAIKLDGWTHFNEQAPLMGFGSALAALKSGKKVARVGWNGKGMWIVMMPGLHLPPYSTQAPGAKVNDRTAKRIGEDTPLDSQPYFAMWTAAKQWQPGWLASQADMLAEDWEIVS